MTIPDPDGLDWSKGDGLIPAIVQHADTARVLMLGYMSRESLTESERRGRVVFFSRSRQTLWMKGETSGNVLELVSVATDCDRDALLVRARPAGPVCHLGTETCFPEDRREDLAFLGDLEAVIGQRRGADPDASYSARLFEAGTARIAQKVGEEGVEVALAAVTGDRKELVGESADLVYHLIVLLTDRDLALADVLATLAERHQPG